MREGRLPLEATGDAPIVVSADGPTFVVDTQLALLTRNRGRNWSASAGLPPATRVAADKVDPRRFYTVDSVAHAVLRSDDGGATFSVVGGRWSVVGGRWSVVGGRGLPADLGAVRTTDREQQIPLVAMPGRPARYG